MKKEILGGFWLLTTMFVTTSLLAEDKVIHIGGMCSTQYYDKKWSRYTMQKKDDSSPRIVNGWRNVDAYLDSTKNIWSSMNQLRDVMNTHCNKVAGPPKTRTVKHSDCLIENEHGACKKWNEWTETITEKNNPDRCFVVLFSGGDAIMRGLLASEPEISIGGVRQAPWAIINIFAGGGAGGGSEIAELADEGTIVGGNPKRPAGFLPDPIKSLLRMVTDKSGTSCGFTDYLDPSTVRNAWGAGRYAFDDTMGYSFYHIGGRNSRLNSQPDGMCSKDLEWYDIFTGGVRYAACDVVERTFDFIGLGKDDAAVGYHSSLGRAEWKSFTSLSNYGALGNYRGHYTGYGPGREIDINKWHLHSKNQWLIQNGW